jgi:hypothetical protein
MSQASLDPTHAHTTSGEIPEPADNNNYRFLAYAFIVGMAIIMIFFTVMIVLLAGAS